MHIVVLEPLPSSKDGGQPLSTLEVSRSLAKRGHTLTLLYFQPGDLVEQYRAFCDQVVFVDKGRLESTRALRSLLRFCRQLLSTAFRLRQPDLIYLSHHQRALFAVLLGYLKRVPVVLHIRTAISPGVVFHQQDRWPIARIAQFIAISQHVKQAWIKALGLNPDRVTVIYNGTDLERYLPPQTGPQLRQGMGISSEEIVISYVGRLSPDKGLDTLIQSFSQLVAQQLKPLKLLLAGTASGFHTPQQAIAYEAHLKEHVAKLNLKDAVFFLGHVSEPATLYQVSDLTVVPSRYPEPFGRALIESMACGVPVIASNVGGIPEILSGAFEPMLFEADNPNSLTQTLNQYLNWRQEYPELGDQCRQLVAQKFSSQITVDAIEALLKKTKARRFGFEQLKS